MSVHITFRLPASYIRDIFAANLRRLRHLKGFSQEELAFAANINRSYMSKLEKAGSYAGLQIVEKLAGILEVEPAELLKPARKKPDKSR
jgi:transcriptional regulator with XRE-family HTH domain